MKTNFILKLLEDTLFKDNPNTKATMYYGGKTFKVWKDFPNDCWCVCIPTNEIKDMTYFEDVIEYIEHHISNY